MVFDLIEQTNRNIEQYKILSPQDVRELGKYTVEFSDEVQAAHLQLKQFLHKNMYRHYTVNRISNKARIIISELFTVFFNNRQCLPGEWRKKADSVNSDTELARIIADFIAGMTDRFAFREYNALFNLSMG
jgi:dGTPase